MGVQLETTAHSESAVKTAKSCLLRGSFLSILCYLNTVDAALTAVVSMLTPLAWAWRRNLPVSVYLYRGN